MSNKIFLGIILAVLIIAGYVLYQKYEDQELATDGSTTITFTCENGTSLLTTFGADMKEMKIAMNGKPPKTLPNTGDELVPYRFGDDDITYTFVGEQVVVTGKAGDDFACRQPFDPDNAPYNFGDAGEVHGAIEDPATTVAADIIGSWQSDDDAKFVREFKEGGDIVDHYEGIDDTTGTWSAFAASADTETPFPQTPNAVYLRVVMNDFPEEILYFELAKLTPEALELYFLGAGGVLSFTRLSEN
jgi:hypothetical protein